VAGETIKEFLVALGFKVDDASFRNFNSQIAKATVPVLQLGAAVAGVALEVEVMVERVARKFEELYYAAQRANSSADSLLRVGFAARQVGLQAGQGIGLVEGLFRAIRDQPGTESILAGLGVHTRDANGQLRDTKDLLNDLGPILSKMPRFQALMYGDALGLDREALNQTLNNWDQFKKAQDDAAASLRNYGIDANKVSEDSVDFSRHVNALENSFGNLATRVAHDLMPPMEHLLDRVKEGVDLFGRWNDEMNGVPGEVLAVATAVGGLEGALALLGKNSLVKMILTGGAARFLGPVGAFVATLYGGDLNAGEDEQMRRIHEDWARGGPTHIFDPNKPPPGPRALPPSAPGPLGFRNNNPGNLQPGGVEATYSSQLAGIEAASNNLLAYGRRGWDTIKSIVAHWSKTDQAAYAANLSKWTGYAPEEHLNLSDPEIRRKLLAGIFRQEGNSYDPDLLASATGGDRTVVLNQNTTINVAGTADPAATARRAASEQDRVNGDAARQLAGAIR
jgi:hypothetical protein